MARAYVALGSNLDQPARQLQRAAAALRSTSGLTWRASSPVYSSPPWDGSAQPDYLNAVVALDTELAALDLLDHLLAIEHRLGRRRDGVRNAPRVIDLDLLLYDRLVVQHERLQLPHPRMHERAFVIEPLYRLAPGLVLPDGVPLAALRAGLDLRGLTPTALRLEP